MFKLILLISVVTLSGASDKHSDIDEIHLLKKNMLAMQDQIVALNEQIRELKKELVSRSEFLQYSCIIPLALLLIKSQSYSGIVCSSVCGVYIVNEMKPFLALSRSDGTKVIH